MITQPTQSHSTPLPTLPAPFQLNQEVYFLTNRNYKEYYISKGIIKTTKFTTYGDKLYFEIKENNSTEYKSTSVLDIWNTIEEAESNKGTRISYYKKGSI